MKLVTLLQLYQIPNFLEDFTKFWFLGEFCAHSFYRALMRSGADVGREGLAHNLCSSSSQRFSTGLRSGLCAGQSSSSPPNSSNHVFIVLALCTGAGSYWNRKGPSSHCFHKVGSSIIQNVLVCWSVKIGDKRLSPKPDWNTWIQYYRWCQILLSTKCCCFQTRSGHFLLSEPYRIQSNLYIIFSLSKQQEKHCIIHSECLGKYFFTPLC